MENILNRNDIIWNLFIFTTVMYSLELCTELGWRNGIGKRKNSNENKLSGQCLEYPLFHGPSLAVCYPYTICKYMRANHKIPTELNTLSHKLYPTKKFIFQINLHTTESIVEHTRNFQTISTFQCSRFVKSFNVATINLPLTIKAQSYSIHKGTRHQIQSRIPNWSGR